MVDQLDVGISHEEVAGEFGFGRGFQFEQVLKIPTASAITRQADLGPVDFHATDALNPQASRQ